MPPLPDRTSPTLAAIHARRAASCWIGRGSTFIPASEAAIECGRAIWFGFRWASPPESASPRMLRLFKTGEIEERRFLDELASVSGVTVWPTNPETGKQWRAEIAGYIAVKPDAVATGLPEAPKSLHVVECKSANDKSFGAIKAKGVTKAKPEHWLQCQLEMTGLAIKRCLYWVVNKNTDEEHLERIKPDTEATERAIARLVSIAEAPRPPGRIHDDPNARTAFACRFCRHKGVCADGATARAHCRTCLHSTPGPGGIWHCEALNCALAPEDQGSPPCGMGRHLFIPDLVAGEQIDATDDTVTYRMRGGETWIDGAGRAAP